MRLIVIAAVMLVAACATGGGTEVEEDVASPFPVERGSAPPPPAPTARSAAPPQGVAAAGLDFGQWRSADPAAYAPAFQTQMRQRYAGRPVAAIAADLQANGFTCENQERLDCRIEIMERQCAFDWYVVVERGRPEPAAGFDVMCLGAQ
jgi:hypothetical protein